MNIISNLFKKEPKAPLSYTENAINNIHKDIPDEQLASIAYFIAMDLTTQATNNAHKNPTKDNKTLVNYSHLHTHHRTTEITKLLIAFRNAIAKNKAP